MKYAQNFLVSFHPANIERKKVHFTQKKTLRNNFEEEKKIDRRIYNLKWIHSFLAILLDYATTKLQQYENLSILLVGIFTVEELSVQQFWSAWLKSHKQIATIHTSSRSHHLNEQQNGSSVCVHVCIERNSIALRIHYRKILNNNSSHWILIFVGSVFSLTICFFPRRPQNICAKVNFISHFWFELLLFFLLRVEHFSNFFPSFKL